MAGIRAGRAGPAVNRHSLRALLSPQVLRQRPQFPKPKRPGPRPIDVHLVQDESITLFRHPGDDADITLRRRGSQLNDIPIGLDNSNKRTLRRSVNGYLFENIGALDCPDKRFAVFLEGLASSDVRPKEASQRAFVEKVNHALKGSGAELRETDSRDGYPHFTLVYTHGAAAGRPKNLIFASQVKPDLRFRDAINNDIEIGFSRTFDDPRA